MFTLAEIEQSFDNYSGGRVTAVLQLLQQCVQSFKRTAMAAGE